MTSMLRLATAFVALMAPFATSVHAEDRVELVVQYTQPQIFDGVFEKLKAEFEARHPNVTVNYRGVLPDYGAGIQALLRESLIGDMPDVTYVGISHIPTVANRDLHVDLNTLAAKEDTPLDARGWSDSIQSIGRIGGELVGLPHAISMPVVYYNADLVRQVGGDPDNMPSDWEGFLELSGKIANLGDDLCGSLHPVFVHLVRCVGLPGRPFQPRRRNDAAGCHDRGFCQRSGVAGFDRHL